MADMASTRLEDGRERSFIGAAGIEPATSGVKARHSSQHELHPQGAKLLSGVFGGVPLG